MPLGCPYYRPCLWCGDYFWTVRRSQKYCCKGCQKLRKADREKRKKGR